MIEINKDWSFKERFPAVSAYTTTYNCKKGGYPFEQSIGSFLPIVDELVVVDGGSTDGTLEHLKEMSEGDSKLNIVEMPIDMDMPGKDGNQKAIAKAMCSNEFCIQFDVDEYACGSVEEWLRLIKDLPDNVDIFNMFVYEPIGCVYNARLSDSHNPVKWRVYRNKPEITHGIPLQDRLEKDDKVFSKGMSDGCFPIHIVNNEVYPSFTSAPLKKLQQLKKRSAEEYKEAIEEYMDNNPFVFHLGHVDLENKIKLYLDSWHDWWCRLYDKDPNDPNNNKYFPGVAVKDVTYEMVLDKVDEIIKKESSVEVNSEIVNRNLENGPD